MQTALISLFLVAATIAIHYEVLRYTSRRLTHVHVPPRMRIILMLVAALVSHVTHVMLYAGAFILLEDAGGFGSIGGERGHSVEDAFYFSITSYTTLGIGDLYPTGALRIISGIEALNGLVMVGWTASMTYLYMEKFWHLQGQAGRQPNKRK
ncbi:potassium channel family protein [Qipengyuania gelatinilytica]|uniref:Potassium channel family protein n=1 Tax=Qipengyuania gelatinilytica TaxID=2867231 RepID=A0ABX9A4P5_9SPHN|nr:potassium channel family protein [Qipengyuania gelatinilytica]QZD96069.1 potassium channel family protein [Qipengyuania gelatinilytica]